VKCHYGADCNDIISRISNTFLMVMKLSNCLLSIKLSLSYLFEMAQIRARRADNTVEENSTIFCLI